MGAGRAHSPGRIPGFSDLAQQARCDEESTRTPQKVHEPLPKDSYSRVVVRGAFVVQLRNVGTGVTGKLEGTVEEVDSGKESQFHSEDERLAFLRECFARTCHRTPLNEGTK